MKKLIFTAVLALSALTVASAQTKVDVIRLENGNTLKGEIVARTDSSIYFRTADGTLFKQFDSSDVASHSQEMLSQREYRMLCGFARDGRMPKNYTPSSRKPGYVAFIEALGGISTMYYGWFDLSTSQGYCISPQLFVGAGAGASLKIAYDGSGTYIPTRKTSMSAHLFATARYYFINNRKCSPYIDGKAGYAIPLYDAVSSMDTYDSRYGSGLRYQAVRTKGPYFNISAGVELNRITIAIGLTGSYTQDIDFSESTYRDYPGMINRWRNYGTLYYYMDAAWFISAGYRF